MLFFGIRTLFLRNRTRARVRTYGYQSYVAIGKEEGARLVFGGEQAGTEGYYFQPTIFADVNNQMKIAQEEIFGPVGVFIKFETREEAVAIANDSDYALAAGVWTKSLDISLYCTCGNSPPAHFVL